MILSRLFSFAKMISRSALLLLVLLQWPSSNYARENPEAFPHNLLFSQADIPRIVENTRLPMFKEYWKSCWKRITRRIRIFCGKRLFMQ